MRPALWTSPLFVGACTPELWPDETAESVATYARIAEASYADSVAAAADLDVALGALVATPSADTLDDARDAWLASREPYLQTEVYRFSDGPIDNPTDGPEGLINAWPLDEQYIDYVTGDADAGLVNGDGAIDADTLVSLNEQGGEKNIATGYHAIEFLLWGQDQDDAGPGARPHGDYVSGEGNTAPNADRRGQYLTVTGDLLVTHLTQVHDAWGSDAAYRTAFEADPEGSFEKMLTGAIVLSGFETGGERLQAALDSGDQEDEHSCFSDNTHRDMIQDIQGIENVWTGRYVATDGTVVEGVGMDAIVATVDAALADRITTQIQTALDLANNLQPPFDQEIAPGSDGNARVQALVVALRDLEDLLFDAFTAFELTPVIPE